MKINDTDTIILSAGWDYYYDSILEKFVFFSVQCVQQVFLGVATIIHPTLLKTFKDGKKWGEIKDQFKGLISEDDILNLIHDMTNAGLINVIPKAILNYSKEQEMQFLNILGAKIEDFPRIKSIISKSKVLIMGSGGLAERLVRRLIDYGFKKIEVVDEDRKKGHWENFVLHEHFSNLRIRNLKELDNKSSSNIKILVVCLEILNLTVLDEINKICVKNKIPFILAHLYGTRYAVGPLLIPGTTLCLSCYEYTKTMIPKAKNFITMQSGILGREFGASSLSTDPVVVLLSLELLKFITDIKEPSTLGKRFVFNYLNYFEGEERDSSKEVYKRDPNCKVCGNKSSLPRKIILKDVPNMKIKLKKRIKRYILDGDHRCFTPEETMKKIESVTALKDIVHAAELIKLDRFDMPIFKITSHLPGWQSGKKRHWGKGFTKTQAYCSGVFESVERYCTVLGEDDRLVHGSYYQLKKYAVDPEKLGVYRCGPYSSHLPIDWTWGWNLTQEKSILVPVLFALMLTRYAGKAYSFSGSNNIRYAACVDSNGVTAGNCMEEAIMHGIFEVLERDAYVINARNNLRPPIVDLTKDVKNKYLIGALDRIRKDRSINFIVKYLTLDIPVPIFSCVIIDHSKGYPFYSYGLGAHFDPEIALLRAITECVQVRAVQLVDRSVCGINPLTDEVKSAWLNRGVHLIEEGDRRVPFVSIRNISTNDILEDIKLALKMLSKEKMDVVVVDRTKKHIGIPVAKIIIPGSQGVDIPLSLGMDLLAAGSNRIFDVPVKLGLREKKAKLSEFDMRDTIA